MGPLESIFIAMAMIKKNTDNRSRPEKEKKISNKRFTINTIFFYLK